MKALDFGDCPPIEHITAFAVGTLAESEAEACAGHIAACGDCGRELDSLCPLAESLADWPVETPFPSVKATKRLLDRIGSQASDYDLPDAHEWWQVKVSWVEVSPGTFCRMLSYDADAMRVSLLVQMLPGTGYPSHEHADAEELHILQGELWIDERRLAEGDYNRADAGSTDRRVWSETGCTCVLITSLRDRLISDPAC